MRRLITTLLTLALTAAPPPPPTFVDVARAAGLNDVIISGSSPLKKNYVLEVNGSGVCVLDYDNDGLLDLYLVNGSTLEYLQGKSQRRPAINHLYRNTSRPGGPISFTDVTTKANVPGAGWGFGCVAADYDNDGFTDLYLSNYGANILYRNRGNGTFEDVTAKAGVSGGDIWHAGAAFGDYDLDGDLDLIVPGYLAFNVKNPELKTCEYQGIKVHACGPLGYPGAPDILFRNNADGTFTDVTAQAGLTDKNLYYGFQAIFEDFDNDGKPEIFIGNDSNPNYLYRNRGDGTFEETGVAAGAALSADGKEMSSMGVAPGDYDGDGLTDLFVTTFANDNYTLFHNEGNGFFNDVSYASGVGEPTIPYLGWGAFFFDYDNDGRPDLFCANGHVYPEVDATKQQHYRQPLQLFHNEGAGKFKDASGSTGFAAIPPQSARGAAYADLDNDGDLDIVISVMDAKPLLLENKTGNRANWLTLKLEGSKSNKMAIGARVTLTANGISAHSTVRAGDSYLSSSDPRLHFGLASNSTATIEIRWPGEDSPQRITEIKANQQIVIRQSPGK